jgi:hypothetical protein
MDVWRKFLSSCQEPNSVSFNPNSLVAILLYHAPKPIPVAARSKAWVYGCSLAAILGSNPARGMDVLSLVSIICCQVEVSATGWSLVQRSPTECGV